MRAPNSCFSERSRNVSPGRRQYLMECGVPTTRSDTKFPLSGAALSVSPGRRFCMGEFGVHPERPSAKGRNRFWCSHSTLQVSNVLDVFRCVHWHWLPSNHTSNPGSKKVLGHFPGHGPACPKSRSRKAAPPGSKPQGTALKRPQVPSRSQKSYFTSSSAI